LSFFWYVGYVETETCIAVNLYRHLSDFDCLPDVKTFLTLNLDKYNVLLRLFTLIGQYHTDQIDSFIFLRSRSDGQLICCVCHELREIFERHCNFKFLSVEDRGQAMVLGLAHKKLDGLKLAHKLWL
jgi:hypothetical protein